MLFFCFVLFLKQTNMGTFQHLKGRRYHRGLKRPMHAATVSLLLFFAALRCSAIPVMDQRMSTAPTGSYEGSVPFIIDIKVCLA